MINTLRGKLLWTGLGLYLLFLLVTLPATVLTAQLARHGVTALSTTGSVWQGRMTGLRVGMLNMGNAEWNLRPLLLLTGKLAADVELTQANGFARGRVSVGLTGNITLSNLSANLPLQSLVGSGGLPGGWTGAAQARFSEVVLRNAWPVMAQGTLDVVDLTGPARQPSNLGAYRLTFPAEGAGNGDVLLGRLESLEGAALDVAGTLKLSSDRSYLLDTMVAARNNAPPSMVQGLQYLGSPDAQGRRPFSVSGTL